MEKEKISRFDLEAAFKALDEIDIPKVRGIRPNRMDLKEAVVRADRTSALIEDYYNLNDPEDMQDAGEDRAAEIAKAKLARIEKIVDLDAESEDDIQPSYVGKTIIQCPQCMTLFYKDPADIEPSGDDPSIVNVAEICQHCGNDSGYTLIGKVAEETPEEVAAEAPTEEPTESGEEPAEETPEEEPAEENTEKNSEEEFNLEPIEIPEEESEEKEEKKESFNKSAGRALNEMYWNTPISERLVKAVIKEYIKPEKQKLVLNEINRVRTAWDSLTQDEKEDWYNSNGTIGFFFDGPDGVTWNDDVFNSDVDEQEIYNIYQDYFINYACPIDEDETNESLNASKLQKDSAKKSELATKNASENSTLNERVSTYTKRPVYKYKVYGTDNNANVLEEIGGEFKADEVKKIKADMKAVMDKNPAVEHVFAEKIDENGKEIPLDHLTISRHGIDYYALDDEGFEDDDEIDEALTEAGASIPTLSQENISKLLTSFKNEPVSDAQTRADLAKLKAESLQTNYDLDFDDKSFNRVINEALKSQGKKFKATNCAFTPDGKHFVVEGLIKENQKISKTVFKCAFNKATKTFRSINENFKPFLKFKLQIKNDTLLTESVK